MDHNKVNHYDVPQTQNLYLSNCYHCKKFSIWLKDTLIFPSAKVGPPPNSDLPEEILIDYDEARNILDFSPRGAAALLRLCVQKLCIHLDKKEKNLDDAIASLVADGLHPTVQKSLDIVRVIGNEAVHPGVLDLKDDKETAVELFTLINLIAQQMISIPNSVTAMYEKIPPAKREAIEKRDKKEEKKPNE